MPRLGTVVVILSAACLFVWRRLDFMATRRKPIAVAMVMEAAAAALGMLGLRLSVSIVSVCL